MLGFTGTWHGHAGLGAGLGHGTAVDVDLRHELFREYDVQRIIRVGSCGAVHRARSAAARRVIASGACTDSSMNRLRFHGLDYAPVADFGLLRAAVEPPRVPTSPATSA